MSSKRAGWSRRRRGARCWLHAVGLASSLAATPLGLAAEHSYAFRGLASASPTRAADFSLMAHTGHRVQLTDFRGRIVLLYFGYTSCPGICPTTLAEVSQVLKVLGPTRAAKVQLVMITLDPERDTKEKLAAYLTHFHPSFLGLTGTSDEITTVAARYGVYYRRPEGASPAGYLIDHTSVVIAADGEGYVRVLFPHGTPVKDMAADLAHLVRR